MSVVDATVIKRAACPGNLDGKVAVDCAEGETGGDGMDEPEDGVRLGGSRRAAATWSAYLLPRRVLAWRTGECSRRGR